jgi:ElaA protein
MALRWHDCAFLDLSVTELYAALQLRQQVFIVEQACLFLDIDGLDQACYHLLGYADDGQLAAYARLVPAALKYDVPSVGRVVTSAHVRGTGAGRALMQQALARCEARFATTANQIGAQAHLQKFYREFGYVTCSAEYLEDGIAHVEMRRG